MPVGRLGLGLSINSTWRESGDQKGWVQQLLCVRRRRAGIGVGVGLGTGVAVGVELGTTVAAGVGLGDEVRVGIPVLGVLVTCVACEPWDDVAGGLGVRSMMQPPVTKTVTKAQTHIARIRSKSLRIFLII